MPSLNCSLAAFKCCCNGFILPMYPMHNALLLVCVTVCAYMCFAFCPHRLESRLRRWSSKSIFNSINFPCYFKALPHHRIFVVVVSDAFALFVCSPFTYKFFVFIFIFRLIYRLSLLINLLSTVFTSMHCNIFVTFSLCVCVHFNLESSSKLTRFQELFFFGDFA